MAVRFGLAIGATIAPPLGVRAQELLLSRPAEGLPDQPVRAAGRAGGHRSTSCSRTARAKRIGITRAHLEEDAGKSLHEDFHGLSGIDLNRAGTPLLEIVSEPDMRSAKEAVAYMKKIHTLVRYLEICDGNMQEGSFRCDANVSVRPHGPGEVRHARRDQEPEFVPLRRAGDQVRGRAPDRADRGRRQGGAGDAPVRPRHATRRARCAPRKRRTTTATSRIPTCCRSRSTRRLIEAVRATLPELPDEKAARFVARLRPVRLRRRRAHREPRDRRLLRDRRARPRRGQREARRELGHGRAVRRAQRTTSTSAQSRVARRGARAACSRASPTTPSPARSPRKCSRRCGPRAGMPTRSSRRKGLRQITDTRRSSRSSTR